MLEFGGNADAVVANRKRGVAKLFGEYHIHSGASEGRANTQSQAFTSLANPAGIPSRESAVNYVIARNIFNKEAMEEARRSPDNIRNLLCVFSNLLPDRGRVYVSTSINDAIDISRKRELLGFTGFKLAGDVSYSHTSIPSYVLERDYKIKGEAPIRPEDLSRRWARAAERTPPAHSTPHKRVAATTAGGGTKI